MEDKKNASDRFEPGTESNTFYDRGQSVKSQNESKWKHGIIQEVNFSFYKKKEQNS